MTSGTSWGIGMPFLRAVLEGTIQASGTSFHCGCGCDERGELCEGEEAAGMPTEAPSAPATAPDDAGGDDGYPPLHRP